MPRPIRTIRIEGDVAYVTLTKGYTAVIDAADVHLVEGRNWSASVDPHAVYAVWTALARKGQSTVRMHRVITNASQDEQVDHRDHDGLNNRRSNLRLVTSSQNQHNSRMPNSNTSGYKGVSWDAQSAKWKAQICLQGKRFFLGRFDTAEEAHVAYCRASESLHGEYGYTGAEKS